MLSTLFSSLFCPFNLLFKTFLFWCNLFYFLKPFPTYFIHFVFLINPASLPLFQFLCVASFLYLCLHFFQFNFVVRCKPYFIFFLPQFFTSFKQELSFTFTPSRLFHLFVPSLLCLFLLPLLVPITILDALIMPSHVCGSRTLQGSIS